GAPTASGGPSDLADLHAPDGRSAFKVGPGELVRILGCQLVVERLGVVIVDQDERRPRCELVDELEDLLVPLGGHKAANVDDVGGRPFRGVRHLRAPLVAWLNCLVTAIRMTNAPVTRRVGPCAPAAPPMSIL